MKYSPYASSSWSLSLSSSSSTSSSPFFLDGLRRARQKSDEINSRGKSDRPTDRSQTQSWHSFIPASASQKKDSKKPSDFSKTTGQSSGQPPRLIKGWTTSHIIAHVLSQRFTSHHVQFPFARFQWKKHVRFLQNVRQIRQCTAAFKLKQAGRKNQSSLRLFSKIHYAPRGDISLARAHTKFALGPEFNERDWRSVWQLQWDLPLNGTLFNYETTAPFRSRRFPARSFLFTLRHFVRLNQQARCIRTGLPIVFRNFAKNNVWLTVVKFRNTNCSRAMELVSGKPANVQVMTNFRRMKVNVICWSISLWILSNNLNMELKSFSSRDQ